MMRIGNPQRRLQLAAGWVFAVQVTGLIVGGAFAQLFPSIRFSSHESVSPGCSLLFLVLVLIAARRILAAREALGAIPDIWERMFTQTVATMCHAWCWSAGFWIAVYTGAFFYARPRHVFRDPIEHLILMVLFPIIATYVLRFPKQGDAAPVGEVLAALSMAWMASIVLVRFFT